ncbi:kinase-like protein [Calocera cornea HHB12733]|uniref:Kinase-like protein n=1 Tax=Calocera cornea HHB12733 TaxID=1353952 RepID=A0A165EQW2_9BASI|nr:kinase-like protein [Calocera cornea HHB12733]
MSHAVPPCIRCAVQNLQCDEGKPTCGACQGSSDVCSYDWDLTKSYIFDAFPKQCNYNDRIQPFPEMSNWVGGRFGSMHRVKLKEGGCVALKALFHNQPQVGATAYLISLREAWIWFNVRHPNIVPFLGIADFRYITYSGLEQVCLISTWMEEGNIMQYLIRHPKADRIGFLLNAVDALQFLHSCTPPIIHGALKGSNILIDVRSGHPRALLTDFGHERARINYGAEYELQSPFPPSLAYRWAAFEHCCPSKFGFTEWEETYTVASDVFELMRTCLEVLSERMPYYNVRRDQDAIIKSIRLINPQRPPDCHPALDDNMWLFLERAWSLVLTDRPDLSEVRVFLQRYQPLDREVFADRPS